MRPSAATVTILDVAARAGVSRTSVSNFFHHPNKLSEATRERIRLAMEELEFSPNAAASVLRTGANPVVGYIAFELASGRTPEIANAIASTVATAGMYVLLATDQSSAERELDYLRLFVRQRVSGLIVSPLGDIEDELLRIRDRGVPVVLAGRAAEDPSLPSVFVDHRAGGRLAAEHLLAQGRRRLAFATDTLEIPQIRARYEGMRDATAEVAGARIDVLQTSARSIEGGDALGKALAAEEPVRRPDGLLCVNDLVAIGASGPLARLLDIPSGLAIVGYDDIAFAAANHVPLTSVRTVQDELGVQAARFLLEEISERRDGAPADRAVSARRVAYAPELVVRASTVRARAE